MSSTDQAQLQNPLQPQTPSFAMLRTLGGIAMLAGFLVVMVFQWTKPIIEENKRIAIEKAIFKVVPGAASRKNFVLSAAGLFPAETPDAQGETIYAAYDANGELQGVALEAAATGYQDVIRILYGYSPACQCVTGIKVLKMAETPGLGYKIAFDPAFLENFVALDGKLNNDKSGLENNIVAVKHGNKSQPWQVDSISGATISSKAIARMINDSGQRMFPLIAKHLSEMQGGRE
ncbi:MAG: FMN-binding protein [Sedimenticola sp.]|nr:MAG: FMN-binding protein [Sedimenticola sp.]